MSQYKATDQQTGQWVDVALFYDITMDGLAVSYQFSGDDFVSHKLLTVLLDESGFLHEPEVGLTRLPSQHILARQLANALLKKRLDEQAAAAAAAAANMVAGDPIWG